MSETEGGRVFFARSRRAPDRDSEIRLVSVGVDIGSSTSHLAFSRLVLLRNVRGARVVRRELLHESDIFLTPYTQGEEIDTEALGRFIGAQYAKADIDPDMIDTGALILTGTAARRRNARAIGDLFAGETGRFVAVTAGDGLETILSAHGSGAVAASMRDAVRVMNIDIGGGTSKIALCVNGVVTDMTAIDIGARLICLDPAGRIARIEPVGQAFADAAGTKLTLGEPPAPGALEAIVTLMAERLLEACGSSAITEATTALLRLPPLREAPLPDQISFSGGVAEYIHGREARRFGDLGPLLADAVMSRLRPLLLPGGPRLRFADEGIRATVIGASQYSVQLSGNTIYAAPASVLPLPNLPVATPAFAWPEVIDPAEVASAITAALTRASLAETDWPIALGYRWQGDATHARIDAFCQGVAIGMAPLLARGLPLVLVGQGDVGGLLGVHAHTIRQIARSVVSIDGITTSEFDFIDIGEILQISGGVPVVVKSLVFPSP